MSRQKLALFPQLAGEAERTPDRRGCRPLPPWSPGTRRRPHATSVRAILGNRIYVGEEIYGRTRAIDKGGTKVKVDAPKDDWIKIPVPAIITQAQWDKVHKRLAQTRLAHPGVKRDPKTGQVQGRVAADTGLDSHHLLSGFLRCGSCGRNMKLSAISHKANRTWKGWYCGRYYQTGGSKLPGCRGSIPYEVITEAVRGALDPEAIQREVLAYLFTIKLTDPDIERTRLTADLTKAEKEAENLANAIALGGDLPVLVTKLKAATAQVESLRAALASQQVMADQVDSWDPDDLADDLAETLRLSQEPVAPDVPAERRVLRSLGVTVTVDRELKEAVIQGNVRNIVASRLSSHFHAQTGCSR